MQYLLDLFVNRAVVLPHIRILQCCNAASTMKLGCRLVIAMPARPVLDAPMQADLACAAAFAAIM
jgi:hypothetical protein